MTKFKTFLILFFVVVFSLSLFGCGLLTSRSDGPEIMAGQDGGLPEWLLLAHRSAEGIGSEVDDELLNPKDRDEDGEEDSAVGGVDEDPTPVAAADPAPAPAPAPAPSGSAVDSSDLTPAEKLELQQAQNKLRDIEKKHRSADATEQAKLKKEYDQIVRAIYVRFGMIVPNRLDAGSADPDNWMDLWDNPPPNAFGI